MPEHIDPAKIPGADLDPDTIESSANQIGGIGEQVSTNGAQVVSAWHPITSHYVAPESSTLFGVMDDVQTLAEGVGSDIARARTALVAFAEDARPIKAELERIRADAVAFVDSIRNGVDVEQAVPVYAGRGGYVPPAGAGTRTVHKEWHEDQDSVDKNNQLLHRVNEQMVLLWAAERKCANAIYDILNMPHIEAATDENPNGYGVEEIPDDAETPWGKPVEKSEDCGEKVVSSVKGFVWDGVIVGGIWGTVEGLGTLVLGYNPATGDWFSGDAYGAAWSSLGMLGVGLATAGPSGILLSQVPGPVGDFVRGGQEALLNAGKGIIAYDQWSEDPAAAAGTAVFNVASILIPAGAAVSGVKAGAGTASAAIRSAAAVMDVVDPASLALKVGGAGVKIAAPAISDLLKGLDLGSLTRVDAPTVTIPHVDVPGGAIDVPSGAIDVPAVRDVPAAELPAPAVHEPALVGAGNVHTGAVDSPGGSTGGTVDTAPGGTTGAVDTGGTSGTGGSGTVDTGTGGTGTGGSDLGGSGTDGPPANVDGTGTGTADSPREWTPSDGDPALSGADTGPGWERSSDLRGNPIDPDYGLPRADHGTLDDAYAPPATIPENVRELVTDPGAPFGRDAAGQPYTRTEWEERYILPDGSLRYPGNEGAVPGSRVVFTDPSEFLRNYGDLLDRMGGDGGSFFTLTDTPFEARALPGSNLAGDFTTFRIADSLPDGIRIEVSEVAPAFGQPGGGLQIQFVDDAHGALSVESLADRDIVVLDRVDDASGIDAVTPVEGIDDALGIDQPPSLHDVLPHDVAPELQSVFDDGLVRVDDAGVVRFADPVTIDFTPNATHDPAEVRLQLDEQQAGLNQLTAEQYLDNRAAYLEHSRSPLGDAAQATMRREAIADFIDQYLLDHPEADWASAQEAATAEFANKAPLHAPDQVAGGFPENVVRMGDGPVNSSIGAQWRTRVRILDAEVLSRLEGIDEDLWDRIHLDIRLRG